MTAAADAPSAGAGLIISCELPRERGTAHCLPPGQADARRRHQVLEPVCCMSVSLAAAPREPRTASSAPLPTEDTGGTRTRTAASLWRRLKKNFVPPPIGPGPSLFLAILCLPGAWLVSERMTLQQRTSVLLTYSVTAKTLEHNMSFNPAISNDRE
jgi:hypothetical protein